jgi:parvulin-like peptidyl-prolyl isomerase
MRIAAVLLITLAALGCQRASAPQSLDIDSKDILSRTDTFPEVDVKHVLLGWKELDSAYGGRMDPRAKKRTQAEAAKLATEIAAKLRAAPDRIDELVKESSEDPGSKRGTPYTIKSDTPFVPEFKQLSMRLKPNEVGIVKTQFGYHVIERVMPPPPDPLQSGDILARVPEKGTVYVQHVLIGWKETNGTERTKADADKLAQDVLAKVRAGEDMLGLMKQYSEDPGSKDSGRAYDVSADSQMVPPFKDMSLRLKVGEAGLVKSDFGWHVIKRVPPPAPDPLESADILAREPVTDKAKVKHILLAWKDMRARDPRAQKRDRATLDKLVADTVAKLKGGAKIEPLMKELSEDPGSAASGEGYDVTPDAGLVPPFKALSLRLNVGEVGVVKTDFGFHIIQRVE